MALDRVKEYETPSETDVQLGTDVLTISVLAIVICAPIGATLMAVLGPRFLVKGQSEDEEVAVHGKGEPEQSDKIEYTESKKGNEKISGPIEPALNYVKYVSEDEDKGVKIGVTAKQICSDCEEKEIADINITSQNTNNIDNKTDQIETFSSLNSENDIVPVTAVTAHSEPPIYQNVRQKDDADVSVQSTPMADVNETVDVDMRQNDQGKDSAVDKATGTTDDTKDDRRPLYVSSIIVELNDSNT